MKLVFPVILGYVLGSVPIGFLVAHYWGHIDIRHYGSGNIGTTNVFRTLGFYPGSIVLIGDIGKGVIAVLLGKWLGGEQAALLAGLAAILGHSWSIFLSFKGGRGVATGAGVFLALTPKVILIAALIWILVIAITGYVSLGSIIAAGHCQSSCLFSGSLLSCCFLPVLQCSSLFTGIGPILNDCWRYRT